MTVKECYEAIGADYAGVLRRLANEDRVERFLLKFPKDGSYEELVRAMDSKDYQAAFRAVHTLKGICLNLSLTTLAESSSNLTEALRDGVWSEEAMPLYEKVKADYDDTIRTIQTLVQV